MKKLIITPTYNEAENIELFLNSVLNQKLANIDIVVVDDNSPDKTASLVLPFTKKTFKCFFIKKKRKNGNR